MTTTSLYMLALPLERVNVVYKNGTEISYGWPFIKSVEDFISRNANNPDIAVMVQVRSKT